MSGFLFLLMEAKSLLWIAGSTARERNYVHHEKTI